MNINKTSWIIKTAIYGGLDTEERYDHLRDKWSTPRTDICTLMRRVLWGLIRAPFWGLFFGGIISAFIVLLIGVPVFELYFYLKHGLPLDAFWFVTIFDSVLIGFIGYGMFAVMTETDPLGTASKAVGNTISSGFRFINNVYRAWKDKTCTFVNIVENEP